MSAINDLVNQIENEELRERIPGVAAGYRADEYARRASVSEEGIYLRRYRRLEAADRADPAL